MIGLALASVRRRPTAVVAVFLTLFAGSAITTGFGAMLDVADGPGASPDDQTVLQLMSLVVGGWGAIIVASAVVTATAVVIRQRGTELGLLRSAGAAPAQVTQLVVVEIGVVSLVACAAGVPLGYGCGALLLHLLHTSGQVSAAADYRFGVGAVALGAGGTLIVAWLATWLTARRVARRRVHDILLAASGPSSRLGRARLVAGLAFVSAGVCCAVATATFLDGADIQTQAVAAEAAILPSIGLALLSPAIVPAVSAVLAPLLRAVGGTAGFVGLLDLRAATKRAASVVMPVVVFTAIATGTLFIQSIWSHAHYAASDDDKAVETLNYVTVGILAVFAAVMVANLLVTEVLGRRREFAQLQLAGATRAQVVGIVGVQTLLTTITGVLLGTVCAAAAVVPYSIAVSRQPVPDAPLWIYGVVVGCVLVLALGAGVGAGRRAARTRVVTRLLAAR